ncbi:hypothetical protein HDV05_003954 [Chytridiales sp. JEL 0842]|nr:hypothetical protein HDV05_003954 [Chytridiales sp. JEL 0842]
MSFVTVPADSDFPIENIPFGVISTQDDVSLVNVLRLYAAIVKTKSGLDSQPTRRPATAIGDHALDLRSIAQAGLFNGPILKSIAADVFSQPTLNKFMSLGRPAWREARATIQTLLSSATASPLRDDASFQAKSLIPRSKVVNHLPAEIGDYTDFYASKEHASNVGTMFRGKDNALMPNWVHLPVGYHGRASSVVVSGTPLRRPCGLTQNPVTKEVAYSQSKKLDYELEMAFFVGVGNELGDRIEIGRADEHIFGMVLMNDWSARDIQAFEYVPLGPFLGKNFGTTISPWIVTLDALEAFRVPQPVQTPTPAEYLLDTSSKADAYDIHLECAVKPENSSKNYTICKTNLKYMYWSFKQMLAHHSINGCNMRTGDLLGSGTISGPETSSVGSLLEATINGKEPLSLGDGVTRSFIEDGDTLTIKGHCEGQVNGKHVRIGFGDCTGTILRAAFGAKK